MINKSLLTLGLVINKLSEGAQLNGASAISCSPLLTCAATGCSCIIEWYHSCTSVGHCSGAYRCILQATSHTVTRS
jgi:hypothetical protein